LSFTVKIKTWKKKILFLKLSFDDNLFGLGLVLLHWDISKFYCTTEIYFCQVKPNFYFDGLL